MKIKIYFLVICLLTSFSAKGEVFTSEWSDDEIDVSFWSEENPEVQQGVELNYVDIVSFNFTYETDNNELMVIVEFRASIDSLSQILLDDQSIEVIEYSMSFSAGWDCNTFGCDEYESFSFDYSVTQDGVRTQFDGMIVETGVEINDNYMIISKTLTQDQEKLITHSRDAEYSYNFYTFQSHSDFREYHDDFHHFETVGNANKWNLDAPFTVPIAIIIFSVLIYFRKPRRKEIQ